MEKLVVISDIHLRHREIDKILAFEKNYDKVVFLGDYFDNWNDTPEMNRDAALWIKEKLNDPKNVLMIGNHDFGYIFPLNPNAICSGFTHEKTRAIRSVLTEDEFLKLRPYYYSNNIIFSHAGLDRDWFHYAQKHGFEIPLQLTSEEIIKWIDSIWPKIINYYQIGSYHYLMGAGRSRGGPQAVGGIIWEDFNNHLPIGGVNQIIGHTILDKEKGPLFNIKNKEGIPALKLASKNIKFEWLQYGWTLGMDTNNNHYLVVENNVITIKRVKWEKDLNQIYKFIEIEDESKWSKIQFKN